MPYIDGRFTLDPEMSYDGDILDVMQGVSSDDPVLMRVLGANFNGFKYDGLAALIDIDSNEYHPTAQFKILETYGSYRMGDYSSLETEGMKVRGLTSFEQQKAEDLLQRFDKLHAESPYIITSRLYSETPSYYDFDKEHHFPTFEEVEGTDQVWDLRDKNITSLKDAENWLLKNHPDYWMGASITQDCPSGNFSMHAVPSPEYGDGAYMTYADRHRFAEAMAERRGIEAGPAEAGKDTAHAKRLQGLDRFDFTTGTPDCEAEF